MSQYRETPKEVWSGRISDKGLYVHEIVHLTHLDKINPEPGNNVAILGYVSDAGVRRNSGRIGSAEGPQAIRKMMAPLSNHFPGNLIVWDAGDIVCEEDQLEKAHDQVSESISGLLRKDIFPLVLGGGHDLAYAHYQAIRKINPRASIGIINLDAHFDLRPVTEQRNSGTPFWQIAQEAGEWKFHYLCLGIQEESNNRELFDIAEEYKVEYILNRKFRLENFKQICQKLDLFMDEVDLIYLTVDMDGFTSALAPGVSAPSPYGFGWEVAQASIEHICASNKLVSADIVELNPAFDVDNQTARLAARVAYWIISQSSPFGGGAGGGEFHPADRFH
jgi:formiminoglutamase